MYSNAGRAPGGAAIRILTALALAVCTISTSVGAQVRGGDDGARTGRLEGRVTDAATGEPLTDVVVLVAGTQLQVRSGGDGRFALAAVPLGSQTVQTRRIGYVPTSATLAITAGDTARVNLALEAAVVTLEAQNVSAAARGSVDEALTTQRESRSILAAVTREEMARGPDGDAAQAVRRASGVTVQDGRYVFVRGLGDRYTTTSLDGAKLPSPEPERRVVPLDLFPTSLLQSVTARKTFTPDIPGDFSGALVELRTREFPIGRQLSYSASFSLGSSSTGAPVVAAPSTGLEWLGFAGSSRMLPRMVSNADLSVPGADYGRLVNAFRNSWTPSVGRAAPGGSFGATLGGSDSVMGRRLGYVASFSYSRASETRRDERRAAVDPTAGGREVDRFDGSTGRSSVLWGGMLNLGTMLGTGTRVALNNSYNRTADNEARSETGFSENLASTLHVDRLRFVERSVRTNQLQVEHQLGTDTHMEWSLTSSGVRRLEPDRSEFVRAEGSDGALYWLDGPEGAVRTFGDLREGSMSASADLSRNFGDPADGHRLKVGALYRHTDRTAGNEAYSIQALRLPLGARALPAEQIFGGSYSTDESYGFRVAPVAQGGSYTANEGLAAGYALVDYSILPRVTVTGGARLEHTVTEVRAEPTVGAAVVARPTYTDVLPSLAVNVGLASTQQLRFSVSRTLSRPEYRELAEVQYRDVIGGENVLGNPELERTFIHNADVRWEWYPASGQQFGIGTFAKRFVRPVERIYLATSGTRVVTFVNARSASALGIELEARRDLGFVAEALSPLTLFSNVTLMRSRIQLDEDTRASEETRAMMGQAPYVVNTGLTYTDTDGSLSASVLYNLVGRRVVAASHRPLPATYEEARASLDVSLRFPITSGVSGRLDAKNLLDTPYRQTQGPVTRESFRTGRDVSLGLTWQP